MKPNGNRTRAFQYLANRRRLPAAPAATVFSGPAWPATSALRFPN